MRRYQDLFFDLDHTLWDFERNSQIALRQVFTDYDLNQRLGIAVEDFLKKYQLENDRLWQLYREGSITKSHLRVERFRRVLRQYDQGPVDMAPALDAHYMRLAPQLPHLVSGASELLKRLAPHYRMHIITNGFNDATHTKLTASAIRPYFEQILSSDTVGVHKPQAGIFIEAMRRAGARRASSLMIGDNLQADVLGAQKVGMATAFYNPGKIPHQVNVTWEGSRLSDLTDFLLP